MFVIKTLTSLKMSSFMEMLQNWRRDFLSDHSNVIFHKSATITFTNNTATNNGGAVYFIHHSRILFKDHLTINFTNNTAMYDGGAIYLIYYSSFLLKDYPTLHQCKNNKLSSTHDNQQLAKLYITVSFMVTELGKMVNTFVLMTAVTSLWIILQK